MAKPRVFVSSTYYDLRHIRDRLEAFIEGFAYDPVLFESGDIPFRHDVPLDESCYAEILSCHILILIIGGRYGSPTSEEKSNRKDEVDKRYEFYSSITRKEYLTARERDIPIFIFVEKNVLAEYETYKQNKNNSISYAHVESVNVFRLLDEIIGRERNNYVRGFDRFDDIAIWLREQWAGLFADLIVRKSSESTLKNLSARITELGQVSGALKEYTELLVRKLQPDQSERIIEEQERKIQQSKIRAFAQEPMIDYLLRHKHTGHTATPASLYRAFTKSNSLEDFLKLAGFPSDFSTEFLESHDSVARRDYEIIGDRHFDRERRRNKIETTELELERTPKERVAQKKSTSRRKK